MAVTDSGLLSPIPVDPVGSWPVGARLLEMLRFLVLTPWNAVVHREVFAAQAPLTPYYLVLLPLLLPVALVRRTTRPLVVLTLVYAAAWVALTPRDLRYLLPIWPILNVALMDAAVAWLNRVRPALRRSAHAAVVVALILAVPGWAYACYRLARQGPVPVTPEARDAYLARWVPGYDAIAWLNRRHGADYTVYTLFGYRLTYYAEGRVSGGWTGPGRYDRVLANVSEPGRLDAELHRLGA